MVTCMGSANTPGSRPFIFGIIVIFSLIYVYSQNDTSYSKSKRKRNKPKKKVRKKTSTNTFSFCSFHIPNFLEVGKRRHSGARRKYMVKSTTFFANLLLGDSVFLLAYLSTPLPIGYHPISRKS